MESETAKRTKELIKFRLERESDNTGGIHQIEPLNEILDEVILPE